MRTAAQEPIPLILTTGDGISLSALAYGPDHADVAVVFGHGFTGSQRNRKVVELVHDLVERGFAVYTADFRGHGASTGRSTYGEREVYDLEARGGGGPPAPRPSGDGGRVDGRVRGAAPRRAWAVKVDAVVAISSPAFGSIPKLPRARVLGRLVRSERGRWLLERHGTRTAPFEPVSVPPIELVPTISPIPVAIVHGGRDHYVPLSDAQALHDRLGTPRRLVVLPNFGHGEAGFGPEFAVVLERLIRDLLQQAP